MESWHWLVVAAAFAVIEVAAPAMVCIWLAAAALGTAAVAWIIPSLCREQQALIFAAFAIASVAIGRIAFSRVRLPPSAACLNRRAQTCIWGGHSLSTGRSSTDGGSSKSTIRSGSSKDPHLPAGTRIRVTGAEWKERCCALPGSDLAFCGAQILLLGRSTRRNFCTLCSATWAAASIKRGAH
jgi:inner membrane protein